jgi:hypothetical protein
LYCSRNGGSLPFCHLSAFHLQSGLGFASTYGELSLIYDSWTGDQMPFSKEQWAEQARASLSTIRQWFKTGDAPYLVYGSVAGLTLWPLVDAAARTPAGQSIPLTLLLTLGNAISGIGANLIAEQLGRWRDQTPPIQVAEVIAWTQEQAAIQTDLRQALDQLLETFQAIPQAQSSLSAADKIWFNQQLQAEMAQLGNLPRFMATVTDGGAVAQGTGAKAVGQGGVLVEGNVAGPIITGTGNTIITGLPAHLVTILPPHLAPLRDQMTQAFNKGELQNLCFDLGIAYDDLPGDTHTGLAQALISYCHERGRMFDLLNRCQKLRPHLVWHIYG